jgi:hypothetical protein
VKIELDLAETEIVSGISISPIPLGDVNRSAWEVEVVFGGRIVDGVPLYGVKNLGRSLHRDGVRWDEEPLPSSRTDKWLAKHRFPLEEALRLARQVAPTVTWNGQSAAQIAQRVASR